MPTGMYGKTLTPLTTMDNGGVCDVLTRYDDVP
jgi:hypothetical protein